VKAHQLTLTPNKTYATRENAVKAVEKKYGPNCEHAGAADVWYVLMQTAEGRWFPVFLGERALKNGCHFDFNVCAG